MKFKTVIPFLLLMFILFTSCDVGGTGSTGNTGGGGDAPTGPTEPTTPIATKVENLQASRYGYSDKIEIKWNVVDGATEYRVLRYESADTAAYTVLTTITNGTNSFFDTTAAAGRPYFYMVEATKDGTTVQAQTRVLGVYDTFTDGNSNKTVESLQNSATTADTVRAVIYSYPDAQGYPITEDNWYVYYGNDFNFKAEVGNMTTSLSSIQFQGVVLLQFRYKEAATGLMYDTTAVEVPKVTAGFKAFDFLDMNKVAKDQNGNKRVFIRLFVNSKKVGDEKFNVQYEVRVTSGF